MPLQMVVGAVILLGAVNMTLRNERAKKLITYLGLILCSVGYVKITAEDNSMTWSTYLNRSFTCMVYISVMLYIILKIFRSERHEFLHSNYETNQLKMKYHAILDNLTEGVITKRLTSQLDYFNTLGLNLIKQAANLTNNKEKSHALIMELQGKIHNCKAFSEDDPRGVVR